MQTFLPYSCFKKTATVLDYKRLGKQRVEARQIMDIIENKMTKKGVPYKRFINHPVVLMWTDYLPCLKKYSN